MLDLCLVGTGGMLPLPSRFLTSLYIKCQGHALLIDCGEGTQIALRKAGCSFKSIDLICITHFHADHISGIAGLLLSMGNADRTEPVTIAGPNGLCRILSGLMVIAPELPFEVYVRETGHIDTPISLGAMKIQNFPLEHRIPCQGYTIEVPRAGQFLLEKAQSLHIPMQLWSHLQKGETVSAAGKQFTPEMVLGPARKGLKVTYATDTRPVDAIAEYGRESDILILEGMYGEEEKLEKAKERTHMIFSEAARLAEQAAAKELWLTHFSPSIADPFEYKTAVQKIFPNTVIGEDGMKKSLKFVL